MLNSLHLLLSSVLLAGLLHAPAHAQTNPAKPSGQPYTVEVWSDATFGLDGRLQTLQVADAAAQPAAFVERVKKQLASARIPPVLDSAGQPATFETGVRVQYLVTPADSGGTVRMTGMQIEPRPLRRYAASRPGGVPADTPLRVRVQCTVGADGKCPDPKVLSADGNYDALRRWAAASLQGWEFAPQRINGQPVPAEVEVELTLTIDNLKPADFRDPRKL